MLYEMFAVLFALSALGVTGASAQQFDRLSGQYQCIEDCTVPQLAFVTQNGMELNLINEAGSRRAPGSIF